MCPADILVYLFRDALAFLAAIINQFLEFIVVLPVLSEL
jgi:hypothetical protein